MFKHVCAWGGGGCEVGVGVDGGGGWWGWGGGGVGVGVKIISSNDIMCHAKSHSSYHHRSKILDGETALYCPALALRDNLRLLSNIQYSLKNNGLAMFYGAALARLCSPD